MELIKIKGIDKKDSGLVIVKYVIVEYVGMPDAEATLNTKWQSEEANYLESLGIGSKVKVTIVQKDQYTNITKVDMNSGIKAEGDTSVTKSEKIVETPSEVKRSLMSQKEVGMCAGGMLKCWYYNHTAESPEEVYDMYHNFVKKLEQNG